jgi:hypothetical protein
VEYLVSHQLLLASMHTLCLLIQPAASFADPASRHHGSWRYWLRFLRTLGERRIQSVARTPKPSRPRLSCCCHRAHARAGTNSILLAVSQLDRVPAAEAHAARSAAQAEFDALRAEFGDGLGDGPVWLDYRPSAIVASMHEARRRLGAAAHDLATEWWVPSSYERFAELVRTLGGHLALARELPIISKGGVLTAYSAAHRTRMVVAALLKRW